MALVLRFASRICASATRWTAPAIYRRQRSALARAGESVRLVVTAAGTPR
jgi:hypothetical protein